jgi:hypothetical protein
MWLLTIPCLLLLASEIRERYVWHNLINGKDVAVCVGDSHALPIKLDSGPTIAEGGDPILISYLTVKRLIQFHFRNIREVFLTVGPQSFSSLPESRVSEDFEDWFSGSGRRISSRLSPVDYLNASQFSVPVLEHFGYEFSITDKAVASKPVVWEGPYHPNAEERIKRHRVDNSGWFQDTGLQVKHLERLIDICAERQVKLYLVGTPLHESYRTLLEKSSWEKYKSFLDSIETNHSHVQYLSFEEEDWPDSLFRDSDHLNSMGGALLGKRLEMTTDALQLP